MVLCGFGVFCIFFLNKVKNSEYFLFYEGVIGSFVPYFSFFFLAVYVTAPLLNHRVSSSIRYSLQQELLKLHLLSKDVLWMILHGKSELNLEQKASKWSLISKEDKLNNPPSDVNSLCKIISCWKRNVSKQQCIFLGDFTHLHYWS